jgi:hypothetical protein
LQNGRLQGWMDARRSIMLVSQDLCGGYFMDVTRCCLRSRSHPTLIAVHHASVFRPLRRHMSSIQGRCPLWQTIVEKGGRCFFEAEGMPFDSMS